MKMRHRQAVGFTLIELMITVAIVGILAAVAYPSYNAYIQKGERARAKAFMLDVAQKEERYFTSANIYCVSTTDCPWLTTPADVKRYSVTVAYPKVGGADVTNALEIKATPLEDFPDPVCGWLQLTNLGLKTSEKSDATCWGG